MNNVDLAVTSYNSYYSSVHDLLYKKSCIGYGSNNLAHYITYPSTFSWFSAILPPYSYSDAEKKQNFEIVLAVLMHAQYSIPLYLDSGSSQRVLNPTVTLPKPYILSKPSGVGTNCIFLGGGGAVAIICWPKKVNQQGGTQVTHICSIKMDNIQKWQEIGVVKKSMDLRIPQTYQVPSTKKTIKEKESSDPDHLKNKILKAGTNGNTEPTTPWQTYQAYPQSMHTVMPHTQGKWPSKTV